MAIVTPSLITLGTSSWSITTFLPAINFFGAEGDGDGVGELVDAGGEPAAAGVAGRYDLDVCPHHQAAADPGRPGQQLLLG